MSIDVDVVVVNYNSGDALSNCLQHLLQPTASTLHICVVDNASTDDSLTQSQTLQSEFRLIQQTENTGFARASNLGAQQGGAEFLAVVNPDCFVQAEQVTQLAHTLQTHEQAALVGCRVLNQDGSLQAATRRRLPTFWRVFCHQTGLSRLPFFKGINIKDQGLFSKPQSVRAVNGACVVLRRVDFEQLRGFDEKYPLHFEDLDLFTRILKTGKQVIYDSTVEVKHLHGHSKQDPVHIKNWKKQGLLRYFKLHRPAWEHRIMRFILGSK